MPYDELNATTALKQSIPLEPLFVDYLIVTLNVVCGEVISVIGIVANGVSIAVFCKLGFHDSVDVTLTALAISDIGSLVSLQFYNIMVNPWMSSAQLPFEPPDATILFSVYPHIYFIRVTGLITAFAALERCVCVVLPLKVKDIFTCKRAMLIILILFLISISNVIAPYYYFRFGWILSPERNSSILRIIPKKNWYFGIGLSYMFNDIFIQYLTFAVLIACTVITSVTLHRNATWKKSISKGGYRKVENKVSLKEIKVVKMLYFVSVTFIVCLLPLSTTLTAVGVVEDLSLNGAYYQVARLCYCVSFTMETVSSSMNAFIYYSMSSKYKRAFMTLFVTE
ncbi:FMRFamide receptor [Biomphalaria pfeifferi]|uniref:FMRFamide receptor n=1 Tax=Biomphalaria pfeifferi TaxID=112525 RepID=A0AAD8AV46_BIOPF|nr:FMRFamide receptor [Biomphalaria pfeifferi]